MTIPNARGTTVLRGCAALSLAMVMLAAPGVGGSRTIARPDIAGDRVAAGRVADGAVGRPGTLIGQESLTEVDPTIRATGATPFRIRYTSVSAWDGKPITVSASTFLPAGTPPPGGWTVVAIGHGTTGILPECAPSLSPNLSGIAPLVAQFLAKGFAVTMADYEGLGEPGVHAYPNAGAAGRNIIDSVRALRHLRPGAVSDRWLAVGGSQGAGAVWGANEIAAAYAHDLHLLGVFAFAPPAAFADYVDIASAGTLNPDQTAAYVWMLMSLGRGRPDFDLAPYRRGSVTRNWTKLSYCTGPRAAERNDALRQIMPDELKPASPGAARRMKAILAAMELPKRRAAAPMLVLYGGRDAFLDPAWTARAVRQACRLGSQVQGILQPDKEHGNLDLTVSVEWLAHRLAGDPVSNSCA